jgi:hypothetical protein
MLRVEIIANHSVEENLLDAFSREEVGKYYTKYPSVFGVGSSGPRMGDAIWPEENFSLIIWCEEEEARGIVRAVAAVKKQFPDEGIRIFGLPEQISRFPQSVPYQNQGAAFVPEEPPPSGGPGYAAPHAGPAAGTPGNTPVTPGAAGPSGAAPGVPVAPSSPAGYTIPPSAPPPVYGTPPAAPKGPSSGIITEYDGQNMDEGC